MGREQLLQQPQQLEGGRLPEKDPDVIFGELLQSREKESMGIEPPRPAQQAPQRQQAPVLQPKNGAYAAPVSAPFFESRDKQARIALAAEADARRERAVKVQERQLRQVQMLKQQEEKQHLALKQEYQERESDITSLGAPSDMDSFV